MADQVRLGIIGIGNQGSTYARRLVKDNWVPELKLTAIADINPARIAWAKENVSRRSRILTTRLPCSTAG